MRLLITGLPGVGKSTLVHNLTKLDLKDCFWIISGEIRGDHGQRVGFEATTSTGLSGIFAHKHLIKSNASIADYKVDLEVIDNLFTKPILQSIAAGTKLIIIDEIGRMEMLSSRFEAAIDLLFDSNANIIATIRDGDEWTDKYTGRSDAELVTVTMDNRDAVQPQLIAKLKDEGELKIKHLSA